MHLRNRKQVHQIAYEQMGAFLALDSDEEVSSSSSSSSPSRSSSGHCREKRDDEDDDKVNDIMAHRPVHETATTQTLPRRQITLAVTSRRHHHHDHSSRQKPHLGSDILSTERDLRSFMDAPFQVIDKTTTCPSQHSRRSTIFTGAEKFVEACDVFDPLGTGGLSPDGYDKVLHYCGRTNITRAQLQSVLAKFPRMEDGVLISYVLFLE